MQSLTFNGALDRWGFNVERRIERLQEVSRWASPFRDAKIAQTVRAGYLTELPTFDTGLGLSQEVVDSGKTEGCFSRQYFRFTYGRDEGMSDGCALERVRSVLSEGGSLREALRGIALDPSFRSRRVM